MTSEYYNNNSNMMIKRKGTKRQKQLLSSSLALTMAAAASSPSTSSSDHNSPSHLDICDRTSTHEVEQDMANCLILLAQGHHSQNSPRTNSYNDDTVIDLYMYQCKTCDRSFPSFQALGGHRASHKRPKAGCAETSSLYNDDTNTILSLQISSSSRSDHSSGVKIGKTKSSSKVHECSICGAEFTSGQALGGHMRRHRSSLPPRTSMPSSNHEPDESKKPSTNVFSLDLNLPAPSEDIDDQQQTDTKFPFTYNEQVIVFSPSALVDCHHY